MGTRKIFRAVLFSVLLLIAYLSIVLPLNHFNNGSEFLVSQFAEITESGTVFGHKMYGLVDLARDERMTAIGGFPVAMALLTDGVIVDDIAPVETAFGRAYPAAGLKKGDLITELDFKKISSSKDIEEIFSTPFSQRPLQLKILRAGQEKSLEILPALEEFSNKFRLGVAIRDYILGVGMVSYVNADGSFAALGHPIGDAVAGKVPIRGGVVYDCDQVGIGRGERGQPGELRVRLDSARVAIGEVFKSTSSGVYGRFYRDFFGGLSGARYSVASRRMVKMGGAQIYARLGEQSEFFDIEIIRAVSQSEYSDKGLVIKVTDPRLLKLTGGIIQGMSGSPIIQNDRIIGAVTHVFVNDPTKGYGIYMDFMHEKSAK